MGQRDSTKRKEEGLVITSILNFFEDWLAQMILGRLGRLGRSPELKRRILGY